MKHAIALSLAFCAAACLDSPPESALEQGFRRFPTPTDIVYTAWPPNGGDPTFWCGSPGNCSYTASWLDQHVACAAACGLPSTVTSGSTYNSLGCSAVPDPAHPNIAIGFCHITDKAN